MDVMRENADEALELFANSIIKPKYLDEEIEEGKSIMSFIQFELPSEVLVRDAILMAAYQNSALGSQYYNFSSETNALITKEKVQNFRNQFYYGKNCVLSGVGMSHSELVKLAESKFSSLTVDAPKPPVKLQDSKYSGGLYVEQRDMKEPFVKVALAFEVGGWHHEDLITTCVLQTLLGGGSSFSAGGPGKGMYSRLYTTVLNRYHWIESAQSFVAINNNNGLLGIDGSSAADDVQGLYRVLLDQFMRLSVQLVEPIELSRAKNMLKSSLMMQLESRITMCEDIVKQVATYGTRTSPDEICEKIEKVTAEDILKLAGRLVMQNPSVACMGSDTSSMPTYDILRDFTEKYRKEYWNKHNFFPSSSY